MNKAKRTHRFIEGLHLLVTAALLAGLALGLSPVPLAQAATITVTNTNDSGPGSLRQAIADANPGDTINFAVTGTITLTSGQLTINKNLTITGPGADQLTISGNNASRVFDIGSGTVTISSLTIADGDAGTDGGGIFNNGHTTLTNCTVSGNEAGDDGGGIYDSGYITLTNCTVSGNEAGDDGGGIYNEEGSVALTNCTVSGNTAGDRGGGIYNCEDADLTLTNCTVSGNKATGTSGDGGGIYNDYDAYFKNTIIANNTATDEGPDCDGSDLDSYGYNLVEDTTDCGINQVANPGTDIKNHDPNLGPLQDNGGPTFTHALLPGSPAIDAIPEGGTGYNGAPATDQRGVTRPRGDNCDIGAYETAQFTLTVNKVGSGAGTVTSDPAGIFCGEDCAESYVIDTPVTLTAHPSVKSYFVGWGGDCDANGQVTMDTDKTCIATFGYPVGGVVVPVNRLGLVGPWVGFVTLAGLAVLGVVVVRRRRGD